MRMHPHILACILLVAGIGTHSATAQHAGAFSRIGFGARGISMGNALAGDISGTASPYYNPAHAPRIGAQHMAASAGIMSFDRSIQYLQLGAPLQEKAGFAVGLTHAAVTDIDGRDNSGYHTGMLSVDEYAGFLSFGLQFSERVAGGISFQFFRSDLFDGLTPARSVGIDIGFSMRLREHWGVGFVADDLLARYSWDSSDISSSGRSVTDNFPRRLRLGVTNTRLDGSLLLAAELESRTATVDTQVRTTRILGDAIVESVTTESLTFQEFRMRVGAEYKPATGFAVRAGLEQMGSDVLDAVRPSAGFRAEMPTGDLILRAEYGLAWEAKAGGRMNLLTLMLIL